MSEVKAYLNPSRGCVDVYVRGGKGFHFELQEDGTFTVVQHEPVDFVKPTISIPEDWAAALAVAIQECGLPAGKSYDRGKLEATEKHLEDMRNLVFEAKERLQ